MPRKSPRLRCPGRFQDKFLPGLPSTLSPPSTPLVTTEQAPMIVPLPRVIPRKTNALAPTQTFLSTKMVFYQVKITAFKLVGTRDG
jgi:hypothetical protein